MSTSVQKVIVGAYAASPALFSWDPELEGEYLRSLDAVDDIRGLELPWADGLHRHDERWLLANLPRRFDIVLTAIPGTVGRLAANARFGLASVDPDGRADALADAERMRADVHRIAEATGRASVIAVELNSAPLASAGSPAALTESLATIADWDWAGAGLVVEHCDTLVAGRAPQKGYLPISDEIAAALDAGVGISINWGRSAIELQDADAVARQIAHAQTAGVLRGLILSGAADVAGAFGQPWEDTHLPFEPADDFPWGDPQSLLTTERAAQAIAAAGELEWLGLKFGWRTADAAVADRVAMIQRAARIVRELAAG